MKIRLFTMLILLGALTAVPAFALDLHQARHLGQVGERLDGYTAALKLDTEINALVVDVNAKRKAEYARIAKEKAQSVDVVAKLAAQQIINSLQSGDFYQSADGSWKKR